eukprot:2815386-Rhodomonas_salina.1
MQLRALRKDAAALLSAVARQHHVAFECRCGAVCHRQCSSRRAGHTLLERRAARTQRGAALRRDASPVSACGPSADCALAERRRGVVQEQRPAVSRERNIGKKPNARRVQDPTHLVDCSPRQARDTARDLDAVPQIDHAS